MSSTDPKTLTDVALVDTLKAIVARSNAVEADLIAHLAEVDTRRLYLDRAHSSLFAFCTAELGFSEPVAYNRIVVARASRTFPRMLEFLRTGAVHLSALRLLAPHLTQENHEALLTEVAGKSKREVEVLLARWFPSPPVEDAIRKLPAKSPAPEPSAMVPAGSVTTPPPIPMPPAAHSPLTPVLAPRLPPRSAPPASAAAAVVAPLSAEQYKIQLTGSRALSEKLREAQDLLAHQIPDRSLATIIERALDLLIRDTKKQRFGIGARPRTPAPRVTAPRSRHIPDAVKREVFTRDGGQCTYVDDRGRRCPERGGLELDHVRGFARDPSHSVEGLRLRCRPHNQHAAEQLYGREGVERGRTRSERLRSRARLARRGEDLGTATSGAATLAEAGAPTPPAATETA